MLMTLDTHTVYCMNESKGWVHLRNTHVPKFLQLFRLSKLLLSYHYVHSMVRVCSFMGISSVNP